MKNTKQLLVFLKEYECGIYFDKPLIHGEFEKLCDEVNQYLEKGEIGQASMSVHNNFKVNSSYGNAAKRLKEVFDIVQRTLSAITIAAQKR